MEQSEDVRTAVRTFILENFLADEPALSLTDSTQLMTTGIVSSLAMLEMVAFIEDRYLISVRQEDLSPDRLDSVDLIVNLIKECREIAAKK